MSKVERRTLKINVARVREYEMENSVYKFHAWLEAQTAKIPAQWSGSARIEIENEDNGYSGPSYTAYVVVSYDRPETDEEMSVRLGGERAQAQLREEAERRQLAALKAKYERA